MRQLLFFSGGTGPRELARVMAAKAVPSSHIVSTFDSGRSSRELRLAFGIPAVGDLRNRLLALADLKRASRAVLDCLSFRLPGRGCRKRLLAALLALQDKNSAIWAKMPLEAAGTIYSGMRYALERLPANFNPHNAQLGNIFLAGEYLLAGRDFAPALRRFAGLILARGSVLPICAGNLHLAAELASGQTIVGQDKFKHPPGQIERLYLTVHEPDRRSPPDSIPCRPLLYPPAEEQIKSSALICFPMGSFYSSIVANTLVRGMGAAIAKNPCPKVFIPNSGLDPEAGSLDIAEQAAILLGSLQRDAPGASAASLLNFVLVDAENGTYPGGLGSNVLRRVAGLGLEVVFAPIVHKNRPRSHRPAALLRLLLRLSGQQAANGVDGDE